MSHIIEVPGGTAEIYDPDELTPRRQRPVEELSLQLGTLLQRIQAARKVTGSAESDDDEALGLTGPDVEINERQAAQLATFADIVTFMWLKSWTVELPFPENADSLLDLPGGLYKALQKEAGRMQNLDASSRFELGDDTVNDTDSPTGASAD
jgi:hypothetical protein